MQVPAHSKSGPRGCVVPSVGVSWRLLGSPRSSHGSLPLPLSQMDFALQKNRHSMGRRYVEVFRAKKQVPSFCRALSGPFRPVPHALHAPGSSHEPAVSPLQDYYGAVAAYVADPPPQQYPDQEHDQCVPVAGAGSGRTLRDPGAAFGREACARGFNNTLNLSGGKSELWTPACPLALFLRNRGVPVNSLGPPRQGGMMMPPQMPQGGGGAAPMRTEVRAHRSTRDPHAPVASIRAAAPRPASPLLCGAPGCWPPRWLGRR